MRWSRIAIDRSWPGWRYGPDGKGAIFQCESDVPEGWTRKPGKPEEVFVPREVVYHNQDSLIAQLQAKDIDIDPTWGVAHMYKVLTSS